MSKINFKIVLPGLYLFAPVLLLCTLFLGCETNISQDVNIDRKAFLKHYSDNIIIPRYRDFARDSENLFTSTQTFLEVPQEEALDSLHADLGRAQKSWQLVSAFEFGPAKDIALRASTNAFPTDTALIDSNIASGDTNLSAASQLLARGLPALDYLLHDSIGTDLSSWTGDSAQNRRTYLRILVRTIHEQSQKVLSDWENEYRDKFVENLGTDVGSSLSQMVNQFIFDYELLKNIKIGYPLGKQTSGIANPGHVEAPFSKRSLELAQTALKGHWDFFLGTSTEHDTLGLDDYLDELNAKHGKQSLSLVINEQFQKANGALKNVQPPLTKAVKDHKEVVSIAWDEIQKQVTFLKTDMVSAMGMRITFQDSDGD